jgi:hypothetical protein
VEGCDKPARGKDGGFCYGHAARKRREQSIETPLRQWGDPRRTLFEAALALGDVGDDDEAYLRVIRRFWAAVERFKVSPRHKVRLAAESHGHAQRKRPHRPAPRLAHRPR